MNNPDNSMRKDVYPKLKPYCVCLTGKSSSNPPYTAFLRRSLRQIICSLIILSLLTVSTPAISVTIVQSGLTFRQQAALSFKLSDWSSVFFWFSNGAPKQETQQDRDSNVVRIEIDSSGETFVLGKRIPLIAVGYDQNGNSVSGVSFEWEAKDPEGTRLEIDNGVLDAQFTGEYKVLVRGAGNQASGNFILVDHKKWLDSKPEEKNRNQQLLPNYDEWDVDNVPYARNVKNRRGNSPGVPKGKTNFNIAAPVLSVPGRGLNVDLSLNYNSQVWSKLDQDISYDMDKDWMAPGWTTGFGKIVNIINGGIVQVDADGTRRFYPGTINGANDLVTYVGQSVDGSFIKSRTTTSVSPNGTCFYNPTTYLKYPDGTTIWYDVFEYRGCYTIAEPITMVPRRIQDRNGNQIEITYHNPVNNPPGRWINQIRDTLGRIYTFNYLLDNNRYYLTSISGQGLPDENGQTVNRTFVRLQYKNHTVTHNFSGLTPHVRESNIKVLSAIYYPATQSGYWFGDADSYSPYGMIRRVDEQRAMGYSSGSGISQGQLSRQRLYSYPENTTSPIFDIPAFSTVTESWEGMTAPASSTTYEVLWDANPRTTTTIAADLTRVVEYAYNLSSLADTNPEKARDGLTYKTEIFDPTNQLRSKNEIEWELGYQINTCAGQPTGCVEAKVPRPKKIVQSEIEGSITLTKTTVNGFGETGEYNQVLETKEYGYGGEPNDFLRRTIREFIKKGDAPITGDDWEMQPRLIGLPTITEVYDGVTNARIGYTKNEYDVNPLQNFTGANPPNFCVSSFCNLLNGRGNLSKTTTYENAAVLTSGELSDNRIYDKAGNLTEHKPEVSANTLNTNKYSALTWYAYPEETVTSSDNSGYPDLFVKSSATYNFNTGLTLTATDADQQMVQYTHNADSWRLTTTLLPTGGSTSVEYDDINRSYSQTAYTSGTTSAGKQRSKINGLGLVYRKESFVKNVSGQDIWDVVEIEYDQFGRAKRTSNPFRSNESAGGVYWSEMFYDGIGRPWKTVSPDGSTKFDYYNQTPRPQFASSDPGNTFLMKDPTGREKWHRTDSDGNIVEVIEPDPNGNGSVATNGLVTKYTYDKLKRLIRTDQGSQVRRFSYDSLGRMISQKMAETSASLNDSGVFVGDGNGLWSDFYTYDKFANVTSYKDARGVTTSYSYTNPSVPQFPIDPLNRVFSVSYNTNGATDVLPSPTVNHTYEITGNLTRLKTVATAGVSTVELGYDSRGRVTEKKTIISSRPGYPMIVNYIYDSLSRVTDVVYPTQYGAGGARKNVHYDFDAAGRTSALKVDSSNYASEFDFNNFGQVNSVKIGPTAPNQITETYNYNAQNGLLTNQKVLKAGSALLDLSYEYQLCSCSTGGGGQVTKIINNLDRNRDRLYEYDALTRLKKATGGMNLSWSQEYAYDRYGNRTGVTARGVEALRSSRNTSGKDENNKLPPDVLPVTNVPKAYELLPSVENLAKVNGKKEPNDSSSQSSEEVRSTTDKNANARKAAKTKPDTIYGSASSVNLVSSYEPFDFDNDNKADISVFQRSSGDWVIKQSGNGQTVTSDFGAAGDQIAPGDYDGDGKADYAVWRPSTGVWWILNSSNGALTIVQLGASGDSIVPADYDGDGKTDIAVWRASTGVWYRIHSSNGSLLIAQFGGSLFGDIPVPADYDGDNKADISVWRPSNGAWYILQSSNGQVIYPVFGMAGDVPVQARYDSDNKDDIAIWRPSTGEWYVLQSSSGQAVSQQFGGLQFGDIPIPADYDGDGRTDYAVWRPSLATWYILRSSDGGVTTTQFGVSADIAVPSAYRRRSSAPKNQNQEIPRDGLETLSYDSTSNRITTVGFTYDLAGNQTREIKPNGTPQRFQYDAAGRLVKVKDDNSQTLVTYTYGSSRERLITQEGNESLTNFTYYAWEGEAVISEFTEGAGSVLAWAKNYIFMGGALLATHNKTGSGEKLEFAHSDRLGTRIVTDPAAGTFFEQNTLPFGTALESESSGSINRRFTSYDRSSSTGLDYAINRFYDSSQGRFTQVDPITMNAASLMNPQTLNLYAYTANDPVNRVDPDGKFWGFITGLFSFFRSFFRNTNFNVNFNFRGIPFSFGFQGHFRNVYVGVAGFNVQVTGQNSIFNQFRAWRNSLNGGGSKLCDIIYPVFPMRSKEWTGMVRKTNTEYKHQFATAMTAHYIRQIGVAWANLSTSIIRIGDISLRFGVDTPDHVEHQKGYQLDIGLFVTGGANIGGVNYNSPNYDHPTTAALIGLLQNNPNVTRIIFNDPQIKGDKIARDSKGVHDNHLHVEFDDGCKR